jgi:hypothetical protein
LGVLHPQIQVGTDRKDLENTASSLKMYTTPPHAGDGTQGLVHERLHSLLVLLTKQCSITTIYMVFTWC